MKSRETLLKAFLCGQQPVNVCKRNHLVTSCLLQLHTHLKFTGVLSIFIGSWQEAIWPCLSGVLIIRWINMFWWNTDNPLFTIVQRIWLQMCIRGKDVSLGFWLPPDSSHSRCLGASLKMSITTEWSDSQFNTRPSNSSIHTHLHTAPVLSHFDWPCNRGSFIGPKLMEELKHDRLFFFLQQDQARIKLSGSQSSVADGWCVHH